jgi:hypothetical protein
MNGKGLLSIDAPTALQDRFDVLGVEAFLIRRFADVELLIVLGLGARLGRKPGFYPPTLSSSEGGTNGHSLLQGRSTLACLSSASRSTSSAGAASARDVADGGANEGGVTDAFGFSDWELDSVVSPVSTRPHSQVPKEGLMDTRLRRGVSDPPLRRC